jgi:hypothetical protein
MTTIREPNVEGGAAFPFVCADISNTQCHEPGMSLRDWFAGQANEEDIRAKMNFGDSFTLLVDRVAARYRFADAMLAERTKAINP